MPHSIETIASTRKKTKEVVRVESLLPSELREKGRRLLDLLGDYYTHVNEKNSPSYSIANINNARDIDEADQAYLDLIQREIAITVPKKLTADKVKLYKNLMKYYSVRGSEESIELFFKILFNDNVEVYYPQKSMLIPSSGTWDQSGRRPVYDNTGTLTGYENGIYTSNQGFLSDTIKLQDSYFYQKFSYVIRTGNNVNRWKDSFNRLVHPAGFIFFGEILIILDLINGYSAMPGLQPGLIANEDLPLLLLSIITENSRYLITIENAVTADQPQYISGETVVGQTSGAVGRLIFYEIGKNFHVTYVRPDGSEIFRPDGTTYYDGSTVSRGTVFLDHVSGDFLPFEHVLGLDSGADRVISAARVQRDTLAMKLLSEIFTLVLEISAEGSDYLSRTSAAYPKLLKFFDSTPMYTYANYTIDDAINNLVPWKMVGTNIDITS